MNSREPVGPSPDEKDSGASETASALVLAGGLGTRLRPLTETTPKCLVPINGVPLLEFWMQELARSEVHRALVNTHHLPEPVRTYLQDVSCRLPIAAEEFYEPKLLGSAGTVAANPHLCDESDCCVVIYADNLSDIRIDELLSFHRSHDQPMTMVLFHTERPSACGIATLDDAGRVVEFIEKPEKPKSDLANAGIYVVSKDAYREMAEMDAFDLGFDVLPRFVGRMMGYVHRGLHLDVGNLEALEAAQKRARQVFGTGLLSGQLATRPEGGGDDR